MHRPILLVLLSVILITGCAATTQHHVGDRTDFSYHEGVVIDIQKDSDHRVAGKLVYEGSGVYFLCIQHEGYYRGLRKSATILNGEELRTFVNEENLLSGTPFGGGVKIRLDRQQVELAMTGQFHAENTDWTGRSIKIVIPAGYAQQFMSAVYAIDPQQQPELHMIAATAK